MSVSYPPPVDKLLTMGNCQEFGEWPDYLAMGFTGEHVHDLIRMATSEELNSDDAGEAEAWAPVHAWRTLGHLRAEAAIEPLIKLFNRFEPDEMWGPFELPRVLGAIGPAAIPALTQFLMSPENGIYPRSYAGDSLCEIGKRYPEFRETCVKHLADALNQAKNDHPSLNGFILANLLDLKAVEAAPEIERAFAADCIDESIAGDWEDVQVEFGLLEARTTKPTYFVFNRIFEEDDDDEFDEREGEEEFFVEDLSSEAPAPRSQIDRKKHNIIKVKNKRAMAKKSRRQNRKKKKKK